MRMDGSAMTEQLCAVQCRYMKEFSTILQTVLLQGESGILFCLHRSGKPVCAGTLVEQLGLTSGRVANILKGLESRHLIHRVTGKDDRRLVMVSLTEEGKSEAALRYHRMEETHRSILSCMDEEDAKSLLRLTETVMSRLRAGTLKIG